MTGQGLRDIDWTPPFAPEILGTPAVASVLDVEAPEVEGPRVLVAPPVTDAVTEVIIGVVHREPFGPVVVFGSGGVFAEVFADVAVGVPPFDRARASRMVSRTRGARLLDGARGRPPGDVEALVDALMAVQRMAVHLGDGMAELDVNPLLVRPAGLGVVAVDALVVRS